MSERLRQFWAKVVVVLRAAPTWLTAAAVVLTTSAEEIGGLLPDGGEALGQLVVRVVAWIGAAIVIIRRVTPVAPDERGLLPQIMTESRVSSL